jgi:DNA polymerase-3 subunit delta
LRWSTDARSRVPECWSGRPLDHFEDGVTGHHVSVACGTLVVVPPADSSPLGAVLLVTGPEELLNERVVAEARAAVVREDPEAEVSQARGDQLTPASLGELAAPSLFSTTRFVVVVQVEDAPEDAHAGLVSYASAPEPDIALVLVHGGGPKGSGLLAKLRKLPSVTEHRSEAVKGRDVARFLQQEVRRQRGRIDDAAAEVLVDALGADLRALAAAADQLAHDFPDQLLTVDVVRRYFSGRADVRGFEIADLALGGRTAAALEELRWALDSGVSPPALTGSFASSVRGLARVAGAPRGLRDTDLARQAGVPPWKLRLLRDQLRGWDDEGLGTAVRAVATADAEVKGAGADAAYSLERMVLTISAARTRR